MQKRNTAFLVTVIIALALNGCGTNPTINPSAPTGTSAPPTSTPVLSTPTITPIPKGKTIVVTSAEDSGLGTLRQALRDAQPGDTITFDAGVFPPDNPTTIFVQKEREDISLPEIRQGYLTIDASNAGVVIDGSKVSGDWVNCISIRSDGNVIRGLQIVNFPGSGIGIMDGAQNNTIGGDRNLGSGLMGQGNLSSGNRTGIDLQGHATSHNTILGNIIGTGVSGLSAWGNEGGIYVANGASHNTIGPNNIIANNNNGIQIYKPQSFGNIITQNSIYDNWMGIFLYGEGNAYLDSPSIIGFDTADGTATIFTCPDCIVELFSDSGNQGRHYEARGKADPSGVLTINKGASFTGPFLTAVTIDPDGNTSVFSLPTTGTEKSAATPSRSATLLLQNQNTYPIVELESRLSSELIDNKIGTFSGSSLWHPDREAEVFPEGLLDTRYILEMGFKRFRFGINCLDADGTDWTKPELAIDPSHDEFVTRLAENGVKLTYNLTFWDTANKAQGGQIPNLRFKTEEDIQHYLEYAQFITHHFKDRIEYYEIWNEPNVPDDIQRIEVDDYINLVKRSAPVIHQEYPQAKVQVGSTTNIADPDSQAFLFRILNSDAMPLVDVISWHMEAGYSPADPYHPQFYYQYPDLIQKIKETAIAHGFEGEFEVDEIHWPTPGHPEGNLIHSNLQSIKYLTRSIVMHRGMDMTVTQLLLTGGKQLHRTNGYLNTVMSGAEPTVLPVKMESDATNMTSYSFSLPNGNRLLAVWNDNIAVDYDPGIPSTVTIPGFAGWKATGIDVLNGFEQELISTSEDGNLVIRDFLLKDYPIIIRLSK